MFGLLLQTYFRSEAFGRMAVVARCGAPTPSKIEYKDSPVLFGLLDLYGIVEQCGLEQVGPACCSSSDRPYEPSVLLSRRGSGWLLGQPYLAVFALPKSKVTQRWLRASGGNPGR